VSTPWKVLALATREAELTPLRRVLEHAGRSAEWQLVRSGEDVARFMAEGPWDAAILTAHISHLHLAQVLAELRSREPLLPILLVVRMTEAAALLEVVRSGITGVLFTDVLSLLPDTLDREIQRYREARLQGQRQQRLHWLESAVSSAPVALAVVDRGGTLRWANTAYLALAGLTAEAIEQGAARIWTAGETPWAEINQVIHAGRTWRGTIPSTQDGAAAVLHQLQIARLSSTGDDTWYIVARQPAAIGGDGTADGGFTAQRHELFAAIAGGIAHDLNNILAPITMAANLLGEQPLSEENSELVETIEHSAERGAAVIRQVLTFAHGSENCAVALQPRYIIREVARLAAEVFPPNIAIRADVPSTLWPIVGDPGEIQQALVNVLLNAREAMPEGGHIAISAHNHPLAPLPAMPFFNPEPGDFVEIAIEDDGPGLDPDVASRAWEPFVTTKGSGQGAGLGLCRVAGVMRSHGGFGQLRARRGKGTRVSLFFPRLSAVEAAPAAVFEMPAQDAGRILVVDDEEPILTLSRRILEGAGYEVMVASEGREALGLFARHRVDIGLVLTDLAMPGMNGFTLLWALRRSKPDLRVMVATGQGTEANLRELEKMGVREVLLKPFSSRRLLDGVTRALAEPVQCEPDLFLDAVVNGD
jgi:two-component system cell cycle sensor histidine kinase/response regulator CckA